jgi:hypothetical protein
VVEMAQVVRPGSSKVELFYFKTVTAREMLSWRCADWYHGSPTAAPSSGSQKE